MSILRLRNGDRNIAIVGDGHKRLTRFCLCFWSDLQLRTSMKGLHRSRSERLRPLEHRATSARDPYLVSAAIDDRLKGLARNIRLACPRLAAVLRKHHDAELTDRDRALRAKRLNCKKVIGRNRLEVLPRRASVRRSQGYSVGADSESDTVIVKTDRVQV